MSEVADLRVRQPIPLAQERRSQPQQILDLQREYADLRSRFAEDSEGLHRMSLTHDAALVSFNERLDAQQAEIERLHAPPVGFWRRVLTWLRVGR